MGRLVEIHILQNFAPSNLNRDDTGAPKDAVFGGTRRARISSQCIKRAARQHFSATALLDASELATRTRRIVAKLAEILEGMGRTGAERAIICALDQLGFKVNDKKGGVSEYLLFLGNAELARLAKVIETNFAALDAGKADKEVKASLRGCFGTSHAVDVALFGRMLADDKSLNVDAASQVAHAISTHRVDRDVDFFTAVDDFAGAGEAVSGMLGTVEFNSSCFYRYAVLHLDLLLRNLGGEEALAKTSVRAFVGALVESIPTGKQNSFAAHNPPSFVGVTTRRGMPLNLANAFEKPVAVREHEAGLTAASVGRFQKAAAQAAKAWGIAGEITVLDLTGAWQGQPVASFAALLDRLDADVGTLLAS
jgi:CRISPR system Cascade subunit CasC